MNYNVQYIKKAWKNSLDFIDDAQIKKLNSSKATNNTSELCFTTPLCLNSLPL
jgi:hypothetical protein